MAATCSVVAGVNERDRKGVVPLPVGERRSATGGEEKKEGKEQRRKEVDM